jgi:hypothetical protein
VSSYEEKKQQRIERLRDRADKARDRSTSLYEQGMGALRQIPFGQPILVGHHSEGRDRRYRARAGAKIDRSIEESNKAEYYERRAEAAESNRAVSSDDPEAVVKLREKISAAEAIQAVMTKANAIVRQGKGVPREKKVEELVALGLTDSQAADLFKPDYMGRPGFPAYMLSNNNANIRRMKLRLAELEKAADRSTRTTEHAGGITVVENTDENRVQIIFPSKPDEATRKLLKSHGFRWSPYNNAWQRQLNNAGIYAARYVMQRLEQAAS